MIDWGVDPAVEPLLKPAGLTDYHSFLDKPVGELLRSDRSEREVRRLDLSVNGETQTFYLKKIGREPVSHFLRMILSGHLPLSAPMREKRLLDLMHQAGFSVMEPVAWGEERCMGLPVNGFLLVRQVKGQDVAELYRHCSDEDRKCLLTAIGRLLGRLHTEGFFQPVRFKDLFCTTVGDLTPDNIELVLIDRETGKPWRSPFTRIHCTRSLARSLRRTYREGHQLGPMNLKAFATGYIEAVKEKWDVSRPELYRQVLYWFQRAKR